MNYIISYQYFVLLIDTNTNLIIVSLCLIYKNENTFSIKYTNGELDTITGDVIEKEYVRFIPDGLIAMNIVNVGKVRPEDKEELKDVIVAIYKTEDLDNGVNLPFAVCRQSIEDLFTKQINTLGHRWLQMIWYLFGYQKPDDSELK